MEIKASDLYAAAMVSIANDADMKQELKAEVLTLLGCDRSAAQYAERLESDDAEEVCRRG